MSVDPIRYLGLAFATADLLFEVDEAGAVSFAAGAGLRLAGRQDSDLIGRAWAGLIDPVDRPLAEALVTGVEDGRRRGPVLVRLSAEAGAAGRVAHLSAFRLPGNGGRASCALTLADAPVAGGRSNGALHDRAAFEASARNMIASIRAGGVELELGLIELAGLSGRLAKLNDAEADALRQRVTGALRAEAVDDLAASLGEDRFAVLRRRDDTPEVMARRLSRVLGATLTPKAKGFTIDAMDDSGRMMRALRFALDNFVAADGEVDGHGISSLSEVLDRSIQQTVARAGAFEAMVKARRFKLMYQPVVALEDLSIHHHEVLVRFDGENSPFPMIRMAEELDIIESLDRAVAEEAAAALRADKTGELRLAVNVSGRTIVNESFLIGMKTLAGGGDLRGRLMLELTESATIEDLPLAQRHVRVLQDLGLKVCLDDFGAGSASLGYLQQLSVDVVKIDGAYVRELASSVRDDAMIRHLVSLCRELNVETVAEMVETQPVADVLRRAGVDFAQGWLFGQPSLEPLVKAPAAPPRAIARRRGAVEQWG